MFLKSAFIFFAFCWSDLESVVISSQEAQNKALGANASCYILKKKKNECD